jgi:hypothetical protein
VVQSQGIAQPKPSRSTQSGNEDHDQVSDKPKSEALQRFLEVLNSETEYSTILNEMTDAFYRAIKVKQKTSNMVRRLEILEERLGKLESSLK